MRIIDADELYTEIKMGYESYIGEENGYPHITNMNDVLESIKYAPTIDAEPARHGHWELYYGEDGTPYNECSNCHTSVKDDWFYSGYENGHWVENGIFKYCPCCGAKMEGSDEI